jgi:pimeloyl-ACP methyl ester carboxylesterase
MDDRFAPLAWPRVSLRARGLEAALRWRPAEGSTAPPWLLVHSINAAASSAELAPLAQRLSAEASVALLDLPGFGDAPRPCHRYAIEDYVAAITEAQRWVADRAGQAPVLCALSLSAEFAARAVHWGALKPPAVLWISPTGLDGRAVQRGEALAPPEQPVPYRGSDRVYGWLHGRALGRWAFRLLRRPWVIRYFLRRTFGRREIDEGLWRAACEVARARGAEHAPLAFLSGRLFSRDAAALYGTLTVPQTIIHGCRGDFQDYRGASALVAESQGPVQVHALDTGALPHIEAPEAFAAALLSSLEAIVAPVARAS